MARQKDSDRTSGRRKDPARVPHKVRPELPAGGTTLVTFVKHAEAASLRDPVARRVLDGVVARLNEERKETGFEVKAHSAHKDHVHLLIRARDREALAWGLRSFSIGVAKKLNLALGRARGKLWGPRYHRLDLAGAGEVRRARDEMLAAGHAHVCPLAPAR